MNKKVSVLLSFILFFLLISAVGCARKQDAAIPVGAVWKDIDASKAAEIIESERNNPGFVIIDVRTAEEFSSGRIAGAVNFDISSPGFTTEIGKLARNKKYLIYCRSGSRSRRALNIMEQMGFREVYNLFGGILEWEGEGLPVEK